MANSNEYMRDYMRRRYKERREEAIQLLGGKCAKCGSQENLQFDHINRYKKRFNISTLINKSRFDFLRELRLCQLLCDDCHKAKSSSETSIGHGEGLTGKRNCYCSLCKPLKREYNHYRRLSKSPI